MTRFGQIAIVGVGLMGGSLGMAVRERGLASSVIGIGRNPRTGALALDRGAIDAFTTDLQEGIAGAEIVLLATPIPTILQDLERIVPFLSPDAIVTDVGSIKGEIVRAGETFLPGHFVGSHPMAGSEKAGVEAAYPNLYVDATWVITPTNVTDPHRAARVQSLAEALGSRVLRLTPESHDRMVAVTSHLPHVLAYALASLAGERALSDPHLYDVAAGSFASATRVAGSSPELWQGICAFNREAVIEALIAYRTELDGVLAALEQRDDAALLAAFARGHQAHQR